MALCQIPQHYDWIIVVVLIVVVIVTIVEIDVVSVVSVVCVLRRRPMVAVPCSRCCCKERILDTII